ncbi:hypothetical protein DdX_08365 [Ditylenchus destructor]|uniref:Uncharacterized protein n=1 Tax=Ditylenchus destructor TaxID=166010 RepID=A0AAD4N8C3_9BILA|nr:hypothetical protein DdX_08365 [Ditylenchus destructor]
MNTTFPIKSTGTLIGSIMNTSQDVIIIVSSILAVWLFSHTLFVYFRGSASLRIRTLSKCMISYMAFNAATLAVSIPMYTYWLFKLQLPVWAELLGNVNMALEPLTVFFLFMWHSKTETIVFACNIICNTVCILSIVLPISIAYALNLPLKTIIAISNSRWFYLFVLKMTVGVLNAFLCAFLGWKVRTYRKKHISKTSKVNNRIVLICCVAELLLEFFPNLTAVVITMMGYSYIFMLYTGPYSKTTQCINVMICAIIYSKTLLAKQYTNTKVTVITVKSISMNQI